MRFDQSSKKSSEMKNRAKFPLNKRGSAAGAGVVLQGREAKRRGQRVLKVDALK
jgi:hypothetical protein